MTTYQNNRGEKWLLIDIEPIAKDPEIFQIRKDTYIRTWIDGKDYLSEELPRFEYISSKRSFHSLLDSLNLSRVVVLKIEE